MKTTQGKCRKHEPQESVLHFASVLKCQALFAALFAALEGEEDYIEAPNLLSKINLYFT